MINTIHASYWGGLFDAEGCVTLHYAAPRKAGDAERLSINVAIPNKHEGITHLLNQHFGGKVYSKNVKPPRKPCWQWYINGAQAASFLSIIEPHLIIKQAQVRTALQFQDWASQRHGSTRISEFDRETRMKLYYKLIYLKDNPNNGKNIFTDIIATPYMAGFFDGEGSVLINRKPITWPRKSPSFQLVVGVKNTCSSIIEAMHDQWGGGFSHFQVKDPVRKPYWQWQATSLTAIKFLQTVLPYLIIKRPDAMLGLEFANHVALTKRQGGSHGSPPLTPEQIAIRTDYMLRLKALH